MILRGNMAGFDPNMGDPYDPNLGAYDPNMGAAGDGPFATTGPAFPWPVVAGVGLLVGWAYFEGVFGVRA